MEMNLTGRHVDITAALRDYVNEKLQRIERHFDHATDIDIVLSVEKLEHKAQAHVNVPGTELFAEAIRSDMYAAIDRLMDKIDRQITSHKEKKVDRKVRGK